MSGDNSAAFVSLIKFFLDRGSNPNVLCCSTRYPFYMKGGGTAMDIFASDFSLTDTHHDCPASGALVKDKIASSGGEFSHPLKTLERIHPPYMCGYFAREIDELALFPEQFERRLSQCLKPLNF